MNGITLSSNHEIAQKTHRLIERALIHLLHKDILNTHYELFNCFLTVF